MAKKKSTAAVEGQFQVFIKPGKAKHRLAIDFANRVVIEEEAAGTFYIYMDGTRHVIVTEDTLEDLTGAAAAQAPARE